MIVVNRYCKNGLHILVYDPGPGVKTKSEFGFDPLESQIFLRLQEEDPDRGRPLPRQHGGGAPTILLPQATDVH
mgnify:CR=1 FL=1